MNLMCATVTASASRAPLTFGYGPSAAPSDGDGEVADGNPSIRRLARPASRRSGTRVGLQAVGGCYNRQMIRRPAVILALLTGLNFLNYVDRMLLAAVLPRVQEDLLLKSWEAGLLSTGFLVGYFATSPFFGARADRGAQGEPGQAGAGGSRGQRKTLIALGVLVWSLATIATGFATGFVSLLIVRAVVGVGEASYAVLAPTIIDDLSPPDRKGRNLAIFYLATPMGSAFGYMLGGYAEKRWGWHAAFFIGGGPGAVLALVCLGIEEPKRKLVQGAAKISEVAATLMRIPLFRRSVLGYCAHTGAVGAFAFWGPTFLERRYQMPLDRANFWFGATTVAAGLLATVIGGRLGDRAVRRLPPVPQGADHQAPENLAVINALLRICGAGVWLAVPLAVVGFWSPSPRLFFAVTFVVELGLFVSTSPINAVSLRAVPAELRASAMAVGIFAIHLLGDLWTPTAVGWLMDQLPISQAMMALPVLLVVAGWIWWPPRRRAG
jgi:MFS transporter, Spinster family, sphingosine-1-phosphate transporter